MSQRQSIRVFIVQNGHILLQDMADSNGNLLVDSIGSFVVDEAANVVVQRVIAELLGNLSDKLTVAQAAIVEYTIHKRESSNNRVDSTVFLGQLADDVTFEPGGNWKWYSYNEIPYDLIYPDVKIWLPDILQGKLLYVEVEVDQAQIYAKSVIVRQHLETVTRF